MRITLVAVLLSAGLTQSATAEDLRVGVATVDITPPRGYRMAGYFAERVNTGTRDPLLAKAIVFRQGDRRAALVFCDLVAVPGGVSGPARARAAEATGIPAANIAVAATHSHTGPLYYGVLRERFHKKALAAQGRDPHEEVDYAAQLAERISTAIARADAAAAPARIAAGVARETRLSFNRRFHMKDGTVRFNPGALNPDIVRPAGPIDPEVAVVLFRSATDDRPLATLTVFALHLDTVGGTEYSADYPGHLEAGLKQALGPRLVSLFGAGTCGDINHIDVSKRERARTDAIGDRLARTVLDELPRLSPVSTPSLAVASATVEAPLQRPTAAEVAEARATIDRVGSPKVPFLEQVKAVKVLDLVENHPTGSLSLDVQVFRLGPDLAIVTLPGEVFVELGLAIKRASPFKTTLVIELANQIPAYVPTKKAFAEGSYEVVNSRVQPGVGERLVDEAVRLLKEASASQ
jgi:hypothetical protein